MLLENQAVLHLMRVTFTLDTAGHGPFLDMERFPFPVIPPFNKYTLSIKVCQARTVALETQTGSKTSACRAGAVAQLEHCLPGLHEAPCLIPNSINKICACNPNTQEVEAGEPRVQGHPWLHIQFQASLGYRNPQETLFQTTTNLWPPGIQEGVGDRLACRLNPLYPALVSSVLLGT